MAHELLFHLSHGEENTKREGFRPAAYAPAVPALRRSKVHIARHCQKNGSAKR
jgi:hypothetical protein